MQGGSSIRSEGMCHTRGDDIKFSEEDEKPLCLWCELKEGKPICSEIRAERQALEPLAPPCLCVAAVRTRSRIRKRKSDTATGRSE